MPVLRPSAPAQRGKLDADGLAELAGRQSGVVSRAQLEAVGVSDSAISRWAAGQRLHRIHPGVYALGHRALSLRGRLMAALLYAGTSAALSHTTAAWLWALIETEPRRIHLTASVRRRSLPEVRVHRTREPHPTVRRGLPVTPVGRTLLDLATILSARQLRRAIAEADFRGLLDEREIRMALGRGRPGTRALRRALAQHLPELAETLSVLEERFLELCQTAGIPPPEINARVGRMRVDALWRTERLAVELDGVAAHGGQASIKRDRERELVLRGQGLRVVRYSWDQVTRQPGDVVADLSRLLA